MKGFIIAFALLALTASAFAEPPGEMKAYFDECKTEIGITGERPPKHGDTDSKAKCFHACIMKKIGKMADGKVILEKELEFAAKMIPNLDDEAKKKISECVDKANTESDECEVAHAWGKCLKDSNLLPHRPPKKDN